MTLKDGLRLLYRAVDRFGLRAGLRAWWALVAPGADLRAVRVAGFDHPIWLRAGTTDIANFEQVFLRGTLDQRRLPQSRALHAYARVAPRPSAVVDGGAYIGLSSLWLARDYPEATIFAVEPDPDNFAMIQRNTAAWPNIVPVQAGLWDRATTLSLRRAGLEPWAARVGEPSGEGGGEVPTVPTVTINQLMEQAGASELLVVKLIIEGAEKAVFRGGLEWLDRTHQVIFMPSDWATPGEGAGRLAFAALAARPFDWIVEGQCVYCYRMSGKSLA
ncbi:MAG: FkbM family methyltransferase [Alphaproteobacteria bacterium]|nr:FkbM family methyltransferase [Alphaproteobacteria bacterium]